MRSRSRSSNRPGPTTTSPTGPAFRHALDRGAAGRAILTARQKTVADHPGYTLTHGELEAGACGAAAPLVGVSGVEGSVGVVMLADAVPERVGPRVLDAAREVADALR